MKSATFLGTAVSFPMAFTLGLVCLTSAVLASSGCEGEGPSCLLGAEGCGCTSAGACEVGLTCQPAASRCERPASSGPTAPGGPAVPGGAPVPVAAVTPLATSPMVSAPRDLDFNPRREGELWVVNGDTNSVTIIHGATGGAGFRIEPRRDRNHAHFMPAPTGIAFGADETNDAALNAALVPGTFATCQDSRNGGNDFMGPVLWSSDLTVFAVRNGMLGSHLDMLHQSPQCMGIAWEGAGNVYWTFDGLGGSISRYDFQKDHGVGNDDHTDGKIWRYVRGEVKAVANVVSHLAYRAEEQAVYAADTGNGRVVKLLATSGTPAGPIVPRQDEAESANMTGATLTEVVPRSGGITAPSGLEIHAGHLYVSDNATGVIHKLKLDGAKVAQIKTDAQPGGLGGMAFGPDKHLYFTDQVGHRVVRVDTAF